MLIKEEIGNLVTLKKNSSPLYRKRLNTLLKKHTHSNEFFLLFDKAISEKAFDIAELVLRLEPNRVVRDDILIKYISLDGHNNQGQTYFCPETVNFLDKVFWPAYQQKFPEHASRLTSILQLYSFHDKYKAQNYIELVNNIHTTYPDVHIPYGSFFRIINNTRDEFILIELLNHDKYGLFTDTLKRTGRIENFLSDKIPNTDNPDVLPVINELKSALITLLKAGFFDEEKLNEYNNKYLLCYLFSIHLSQQLEKFDIHNDSNYLLLLSKLSGQYSKALFYLYPDFSLNKESHVDLFIQHINLLFLCKTYSDSLKHFLNNIIKFNDFDFLKMLFDSHLCIYKLSIPFREVVRNDMKDKKSLFFIFSQALDNYELMCVDKEKCILNKSTQSVSLQSRDKSRI